MNIPTPDEFTKQGGYNPFPLRWEKWLSEVRQGILSAQPQAGRNVSIDEHPGKGTVINVERRPGVAETGCPAGCPECTEDEKSIDLAEIEINYDACTLRTGGSFELRLVDDINLTGYAMSGHAPYPPGGCYWADEGSASTALIASDTYLTEDCSDDPTHHSSNGWDIWIACICNVWYCYIGLSIQLPAAFDDKYLFFYGTGSSATLTNISTYSAYNALSIDDPFIEWLTGETGPQLFTGMGQNGTVTFHP